jgi:hypothetical protein
VSCRALPHVRVVHLPVISQVHDHLISQKKRRCFITNRRPALLGVVVTPSPASPSTLQIFHDCRRKGTVLEAQCRITCITIMMASLCSHGATATHDVTVSDNVETVLEAQCSITGITIMMAPLRPTM